MKRTLGFLAILAALPATAQVAINGGATYQTMDGFGAAVGNAQHSGSGSFCGSLLRNLTTGRAQQYVSPSAGAGLSVLRLSIWAPDATCTNADTAYYDDTYVQMLVAQNPNLKIWGASWSPGPAWTTGGDRCSPIAAAHYQDFATFLKNWILHENSVGIPIYGISPQNEPDYNSCGNQPVSAWSATNFHDFIFSYLKPTLDAAGLSAVHIILPDVSSENSISSLAGSTMADASLASDIAAGRFVIATHQYTQNLSVTAASLASGGINTTHFWETEIADLCYPCNPNMSMTGSWGALDMATNLIHPFIVTQGGTNWNWWIMEEGNVWTDDEVLADNSGALTKRLYAIGNYAKFVIAGWVRIDATANPTSGVYVSAFKNPTTGEFAIVAINNNGSTSAQTFNLSGLTASSVTPWLTDASHNLASQTGIGVSSNSFNATLAAQSVTTFYAAGSGGTCTISPTSIGPYTAGQTITPVTFTASGTTCSGTWSLSGNTNTGLSINSSTGVVSGTAGTAGTYGSFTVSQGSTTDAMSLTINAAPSITTTSPMPGGNTGVAYSQSLSISGGTGTVTCAVTSGTLPTGLSLSGCTINGTPSAVNTYNFSVTPTDVNGISGGAKALSITISSSLGPAAQVFLTPSGTATGNCPAGTSSSPNFTVAQFNNSANWGTGIGQIGPGTNILLCGTITVANASSGPVFQGSGSAGSPIALTFDTGASITSNYCATGAGGGGCLVVSTETTPRSYITIDGGTACGWNIATNSSSGACRGKIVNTANGTSLANHQTTNAIEMQACRNCEVRNLEIGPLYVSVFGDSVSNPQQTTCLYMSGQNLLIHDNKIHDAGWCVFHSFDNGDTNVRVYNNEIYNVAKSNVLSTGFAATIGSNEYWYGNYIHDYGNWASNSCNNHTGGMIAYGSGYCAGGVNSGYACTDNSQCPASSCHDGLGQWNGFYAYNNIYGGDTRCMTSHIYLSADTNTHGSHALVNNAEIFNNVFWGAGGAYLYSPNGYVIIGGNTNHYVLNNTFVGEDASCGAAQGAINWANITQNGYSLMFKNNAFQGHASFILSDSGDHDAGITADYNAYACTNSNGNAFAAFFATCTGGSNNGTVCGSNAQCTGGGTCSNGGTGGFSQYKTNWYGQDAHAVCPAPCTGSPMNANSLNISTSTWKPVSGSAVQGNGTNLTSLCTGAMSPLCNDPAGVARPASGAWDIGAFQYATGGTPPTITTSSLPNGTVGVAYSQAATATGDATITWTVASGSLPAGLSGCNNVTGSSCTISGTPTTANTYGFSLQATNASGTATQPLSITISTAGPAPSGGVFGGGVLTGTGLTR